MKNILIRKSPESVTVDGKSYAINTDHRTCLTAIIAFEDPELTPMEKYTVMIRLLFQDIPENVEEAMKAAVQFLDGPMNRSSSDAPVAKRVYSFAKDANLIFAAFRQTHGIDLSQETLHWWTFLALFMDLGADTAFCNLVSLRTRVKNGKATKAEKQQAKEMGDLFKIEDYDTRTLEQKEAERRFMELENSRQKNARS